MLGLLDINPISKLADLFEKKVLFPAPKRNMQFTGVVGRISRQEIEGEVTFSAFVFFGEGKNDVALVPLDVLKKFNPKLLQHYPFS